MMSWRWLLLVFCFGASAAGAQEAGAEPPKLGQPPDFSGLVGVFQIRYETNPKTIAVEEPITLTVTITGRAVAPYVPKRDHLRIFPEGVARDFFIEPGGEKAADGAWEFTYHLRPKHTRVQFVPGLKLVYYAPRQRRYQTAYADAIPLIVTARPDRAVKIEGLKVIQAPASFFELTDKDTMDSGRATAITIQAPQLLLPWLFLPPLLCVPAAWWWSRRRRRLSDPARRQKRLVNQTVAALAKPPSDAATITRLLSIYLRQRLDFPAVELTPMEAERWLKRRGVTKPTRQQWRELLEGYDARRFAPGFDARTQMDGSEAVELIQLLEDEACVARR